MELMTPQILWKDFDTQAPFDETVLRFVDDGGRKIKEFYFNGLRTDDGVVRIFARYFHNGDDLPTLVCLGDEDSGLEIPSVMHYNCLVVDYTGVRKGKNRGTMYPFSLSSAITGIVEKDVSPKLSKWYAWTSVAMYAVLYAQQNCGNGKVGVVGLGRGGSLVWKLSATVSVDVGVTIFSTGYEPSVDDLYYRAGIDNRSYSPILKFPVLEIVSSNESDGSLEFMSEIFSAIKRTDCRLCINERSNHMLGKAGLINIERWLRHYFGEYSAMPNTPTVRPYESGGKLYYEIMYDGNPDEIDLYTSIGEVNGAERNWSRAALIKLEHVYLAQVSVYDVSEPISAFATVKEHGYKFSSVVVTRFPQEMGVKPEQSKSNRLVYDSDMGIDDWARHDNEKPIMQQGPFGIEGVSAIKPLVTFKLADVRYKGCEGSLLQIMFCSKTAQVVKFAVTDNSKRTFVCEVNVDNRQGWVTKNFAAEDFKMQNESMRWEDVVTFEIIPSDGAVLVSSLLWV